MADLDADIRAATILSEMLVKCRERKINLTDLSVRFLRLAAEGIIKEPPVPTTDKFEAKTVAAGSEYWDKFAREMIEKVLSDKRIVEQMERHKQVRFPTTVHIVSDVTDEELRGIGFKG
jgi:hypothetical protein